MRIFSFYHGNFLLYWSVPHEHTNSFFPSVAVSPRTSDSKLQTGKSRQKTSKSRNSGRKQVSHDRKQVSHNRKWLSYSSLFSVRWDPAVSIPRFYRHRGSVEKLLFIDTIRVGLVAAWAWRVQGDTCVCWIYWHTCIASNRPLVQQSANQYPGSH